MGRIKVIMTDAVLHIDPATKYHAAATSTDSLSDTTLTGSVAASPTRRAMKRKEKELKEKYYYRMKPYFDKIMAEYDTDQGGALEAKEILELMTDFFGHPPEEGDVELVMRLGGDTVHAHVTAEELPRAIATLTAIKDARKWITDTIAKYDVNGDAGLENDELKQLLTDLNDGYAVGDGEVADVMRKGDADGSGHITGAELQAAVMAWYVDCKGLEEAEVKLGTVVKHQKGCMGRCTIA